MSQKLKNEELENATGGGACDGTLTDYELAITYEEHGSNTRHKQYVTVQLYSHSKKDVYGRRALDVASQWCKDNNKVFVRYCYKSQE